MTTPLVLLSIGALFAGYVGVAFSSNGSFLVPHGRFHHFLSSVFPPAHGSTFAEPEPWILQGHNLLMISGLISIWGIVTAWYFYRRRPTIPMAIALSSAPVYRLFYHKYYVDELYDVLFVQPLYRLGEICYGIDRYFINAILWIISAVPRAIGFGLRTWQNGAMQGYALAMVIGLLVMVWWMLVGS